MELERLRNSDDPRRGAVAGLEIKNVGEPDETRPFTDKGQAAVVNIAGHPVLYVTYEPGWRWSEHLKPVSRDRELRGDAPAVLPLWPVARRDEPWRAGRDRPG
jgi:hypothetical protein